MCKGTKNVQGNKKCAKEQTMCKEQKTNKGTKNVPMSQNEAHKVTIAAKCYLHIMELNCHVCLVWPYVALYDLMWSSMFLLLFMAMCGLI